MTGTIFVETLRRSWRQMIYWGLGFAIYAIYPFLMVPNEASLETLKDITDGFNPEFLAAFGIDSTSFSSVAGLVGYSFFGYLLLMISIFSVIAGLNISANEEDNGIMDMVLSLPVKRWQVIVEKLFAYIVMLIGILAIAFMGLMFGSSLSQIEVDITTTRFLEGIVNVIPGAVLVMCFTAFIGVLVRQRSLATAIAGSFVVISYLVDGIGRAANNDTADTIRQISIFAHYNGTKILETGLTWGTVIMLSVIAGVLAVGTIELFKRRDIAV
ncbi:MAG: hypothetical protein D6711_13585 [Chloroflexi bacterium]|nr:MAG: hypothetical protein D6711_13585 [Chloroflexota bacterium]